MPTKRQRGKGLWSKKNKICWTNPDKSIRCVNPWKDGDGGGSSGTSSRGRVKKRGRRKRVSSGRRSAVASTSQRNPPPAPTPRRKKSVMKKHRVRRRLNVGDSPVAPNNVNTRRMRVRPKKDRRFDDFVLGPIMKKIMGRKMTKAK